MGYLVCEEPGFGCEELGFACEELALGDVLGRLAEEVPVEGRAPAPPVEAEARLPVLGCVEGWLLAEL